MNPIDQRGARSGRSVQRVFLVSLPAIVEPGDDYLADGHSFHLGLAYLGAVLREHGRTVGVLDSFAESVHQRRPVVDDGWEEYGLTDEQIVERIADFQPDLIGLTIPFSCQHYMGQRLGRLIKQRLPGVLLVAGGNHVTAATQVMDAEVFDWLVMGEGELTFPALIDALEQGQSPEGMLGIVRPGEITLGKPGYIEDLDALPLPALDLLPLDKIWNGGRRWIIMVATRGCNNACNFCSIHIVMGRRIRRRSIQNVLDEIDLRVKRDRIQDIYFEDDNMTGDPAWAKELFRQIAARRYGLRLYARNGIRADTVDRELLQLMKKAGFQDFMIAPESGSQQTLDHIIGKHMRLEDCTRAVQLAHEVNLDINLFFVIGFPGETWEDIEQTVAYAHKLRKMGAKGVWLSLASPYPGTRLFRQCMEQGLMPEEFDYRRCRTVDYQIHNPLYTAEELKAYRAKVMAELAPHTSKLDNLRNALRYLVSDPGYFITKLRYKLNL
ncbi:MAG: B12-binding domain-containing radical SAM protein [Anaerolineae bacterium]|nr:B12-binding domain-containing radical SAM protein [Anaerolineae bacterium]